MKLEERRRIHDMSKEQLQHELAESERTLLNHQFDAGLKRLTNPAGLHNTRKRIAMLKTLIRERELLADSGFTSMEEYKAYRVTERKVFQESRKAR